MAFKNQKRRWHCLSGVPPTEMDKTIMYWENNGQGGADARLDQDT